MAKSKSKTNRKSKGGRKKAKGGEFLPIMEPLSKSFVMRPRQPEFKSSRGSVVISHCEEISNVGTSATAGAYVDAVIPIMPTSFPWLGSQALGFSNYRFTELHLSYVTQTATTVTGRQGMAFIYDPSDGPVTSMSTLSAIKGAIISPVWAGGQGYGIDGRDSDVVTGPDIARMRVTRRVKGLGAFNSLSNSDKLLFCNSWLITATQGSSSLSLVVGAIYARYTCVLSDPLPASINN